MYTYIVRYMILLHQITLKKHSYSGPTRVIIIQIEICLWAGGGEGWCWTIKFIELPK